MRKIQKYTVKVEAREGLVCNSYSHRTLTNLTWVSHNLLFPLADYIEQKQSSVLIVVWDKISKSMQRVTTSRHSGLCPVRDNSISHQ